MISPRLAMPPELLSALVQHLPLPLLVVDLEGTLLFFNEPASRILGKQFRLTGKLLIEEWSGTFLPTDDRGMPIVPEDFPLVIALTRGAPAHQRFWARIAGRSPRELEVTALPVEQDGQVTGAIVFFWEKV